MYLKIIVYTVVLLESKALGDSPDFMQFKRVPLLDGLVFPQNLLFKRLSVRSKLDCASACVQTPGCWTFTFHPSGLCQGHNAALTAVQGTSSLRAKSYQTGNWLERSCATEKDCQTNVLNVTCLTTSSRCLCTPGYFYSVSTRACISECPYMARQNTFIKYPGWRITGNNIDRIFNSRLDLCKDLCLNNYPACITVEFNNHEECNIGAFTPLDKPLGWMYYQEYDYVTQGIYDYYLRMCS